MENIGRFVEVLGSEIRFSSILNTYKTKNCSLGKDTMTINSWTRGRDGRELNYDMNLVTIACGSFMPQGFMGNSVGTRL